MKRTVRRILFIVASVVALYLALGMLAVAIMNHIYKLEMKLPQHATHAQVRQVFKHFRETGVTYADIEPWWTDARSLARRPGHSVYRYDFIIKYFCVHVVYDQRGRMVALVETYE